MTPRQGNSLSRTESCEASPQRSGDFEVSGMPILKKWLGTELQRAREVCVEHESIGSDPAYSMA